MIMKMNFRLKIKLNLGSGIWASKNWKILLDKKILSTWIMGAKRIR